MIVIQGRGVSAGIVQGRLHCFHRVGAAAVKRAGADPTEECARLAGAQDQAIRQLEALAERCGREVSSEAGMVFSTHAMLLEDESFLEYIKDIINREHCCAEYAVQQAGKTFAATFEELKEQGYLTSEPLGDGAPEGAAFLHWEDGCLFSITPSEDHEGEDYSLPTLFFNAEKWRSSLGAYTFYDCSAMWPQGGTWTGYQIGSEMIS